MFDNEHFNDPEQKLWGNVLLQALADLSGREPLAKSARRWFSSKEESIGSFAWVCYHLSLDPDAVRERVLLHADARRPRSLDHTAEATNRAA
jgi:hypothetical protein